LEKIWDACEKILRLSGLAPHLSMKPKASSKKDLKDFKSLKDFKAFWFSPAFIYEAEGFV
jgi:hypothetical protein